jgi:hypothetical protein
MSGSSSRLVLEMLASSMKRSRVKGRVEENRNNKPFPHWAVEEGSVTINQTPLCLVRRDQIQFCEPSAVPSLHVLLLLLLLLLLLRKRSGSRRNTIGSDEQQLFLQIDY